MDSHYSPHFKKSELDCGCGCVTPPHIAENLRELAGYLEIVRERIRQPITVSPADIAARRTTEKRGAEDTASTSWARLQTWSHGSTREHWRGTSRS